MRRAALRAIWQDPTLRRVVLAFGAFAVAEAASWIALFVYAYERGGLIEVGLVNFLLLAPAALLAPVAAPLGDRFRRDTVLAAGYGAQTLCLFAAAVAMARDTGGFAVYALATALGAAITLTRPVVGALLPSLTRQPANLSAANAAIGVLENVGHLLGPLAAAGLLLLGSPTTVLAATAALMAAAFVGVTQLGLDARLAKPPGHPGSLRSSVAGGLAFLRRDVDLLLLLSCVAAPSLLEGAVDVLLVAVATEQLGQGSHFAGYLGSAFGFGGLLGAAAAVWIIGRRGLAVALCLAGLLASAPIAALPAAALVPAVLGCLFASGVGRSFGGVVGTTLIQRTSPDRFRAGIFGVREGLENASLALGGLLVSATFAWLGLTGTLLVVGALVPAVLLVSLPRLLAIDASAGAPGRKRLAALRRDPIFAPLPPPAIERLASQARVVEARAGAKVIREGEFGDRYYCVLEGDLRVRVGGRVVRTLGRGDSFGEIALLRAVPRTATVEALGPAILVAVDRRAFLETVTGHPASLRQATAEAQRHLRHRNELVSTG